MGKNERRMEEEREGFRHEESWALPANNGASEFCFRLAWLQVSQLTWSTRSSHEPAWEHFTDLLIGDLTLIPEYLSGFSCGPTWGGSILVHHRSVPSGMSLKKGRPCLCWRSAHAEWADSSCLCLTFCLSCAWNTQPRKCSISQQLVGLHRVGHNWSNLAAGAAERVRDMKLVLCIWGAIGGSSGEGNGTPFQYSCLENPMDGGAW